MDGHVNHHVQHREREHDYGHDSGDCAECENADKLFHLRPHWSCDGMGEVLHSDAQCWAESPVDAAPCEIAIPAIGSQLPLPNWSCSTVSQRYHSYSSLCQRWKNSHFHFHSHPWTPLQSTPIPPFSSIPALVPSAPAQSSSMHDPDPIRTTTHSMNPASQNERVDRVTAISPKLAVSTASCSQLHSGHSGF